MNKNVLSAARSIYCSLMLGSALLPQIQTAQLAGPMGGTDARLNGHLESLAHSGFATSGVQVGATAVKAPAGKPMVVAVNDTQDEPLAEIAAIAFRDGESVSIDGFIAKSLGLTTSEDDQFPVRQRGKKRNEEQKPDGSMAPGWRRHISVSNRRGNVDILFSIMSLVNGEDAEAWVYLTSPAGKLAKAAHFKKGHGLVEMLKADEAQPIFEKEIAFWKKHLPNPIASNAQPVNPGN